MANIKIDVVSLDGNANVVLPDGSVYPLDQVTDIDTNSVIQVADNGEVTLLLDGNLVTLTSGQSLAISNFLSSQSDEPAPFVESESSIAEDSIDDLLAEFGEADTPTSTDSFAEALAGDGDLLENLEATAAGISDGGGGAEGGNNFVRVARIAEETNPAAFEFSQTTQDNQNDSFEPLDGVGENNALAEEPELTVSVAEFSATTQPTVTGETNQPAGTPVTVTFSDESGNVSSLEVIVDDNGNFSATAPDELSEGGFTVEAELADGLGNPVTAEQSGNIDVTAPELAVTPADSGTGNTPVISGQTDQPPGSDVTVTITDANGDTQVVTGEVADDGTFTVTAPELPEGDYTVDVTVVDAAGNTTTSTQSGTVDTIAPTLTVTPVDSGTGNTPVISGQTDQPPGSDVTVTITDANGDTQVVTGEVADDGTFTVTAPELPEGDYTVDVTVVDAAGNTTTSTQSGTVDTTAPTLDVTPVDSGTGNTPVISGQTDQPPGSDVTVTITDANGDTQVVTGEVADDGTFTVTAPELPEGDYTVDVTVVDAAGNTTTSTQSGTVDTTAPTLTVTPVDSGTGNTPVISGQTDQPPGSDVTVTITDANGDTQVVTGEIADDGTFTVTAPELPEGDYTVDVTVVDAAGNTTTSTQSGTVDTTAPTLIVNDPGTGNDNTPTISGTGEVDAVVTVTVTDSLGNTQTIETVVDADGNYSVDVPDALAEGEYTVTVTAEDVAGNTSTQTVTAEVNSAAPTLTLDPPGLGSDATPTLTLTNPGETNDTTPTLTGTGEAGATVTLTITDANGATQTVTTTVDGSGNFSVDVPTDLAEGNFTVSATTSDDAGNTASASGTGNIDTTAPVLTLTNLGETNDTTPTLTGTGEAGATVTLTITDANGATQTVTTTVDGSGNFSVDVPTDLAEGSFTVNATTSDDAGNSASASSSGLIDTTAPAITVNDPGTGNDSTPTITGSGEVGAVVTVTVTDSLGNTQTIETVVDTDGNYSVDVPDALADGEYTVTVTAEDGAGNTSTQTVTAEVNSAAPTLILDPPGLGSDATPTLTGTGEAGATVTLTITDANGATQTVTTTVDGSGNFSVDVPTDLAEGNFTVSATTSDDAGNTASASGTGNIDTTAPLLTLTNPGDTNDTTPTLTGTGEAGATVTLTITDANGATQTVTTTVDGSGNFSVDVPTDLAEGNFTVSATTSDDAGNTASASGTGNIYTTAPVLTLTNPGETNDTTPTLTGTGEAGATVTLTITDANGATQTVTTTVDGAGNFSVDVPIDLAEGNFTVSATTSDDAGNTASASGTGNIDTTAPVLTLTNPGDTNDTTPTLTGTGEAGATVSLTITDANGATQTVTTTVDGSGNFSVDVPTDLAEGNFTVSATTSDAAGNTASASGTGNIDTTAPVLTLTNPGETNDTTPTLTGTGEAGATVTLTITDANGATQTVTTTVDGSGNFSVDVPTDLAEGSFTVSATTSDDAGNTASASGTGNIDTTAPVLTLTNPGETNDTTPTLTGTGEAGATVTLTITDANGATQTVTTTVDGSGNFSVDVPTDLAEGSFTVSATTSDAAGNTASASGTGNIDTTAPALTLTNPGETNDTTPTLTGTGEAGATVTLTITDANGTTQTVTTTVDGSGNFSVDVPTDLAEGNFTVSVTTSDAAGNTASASGTGNIDTTAPVLSLNNPGDTNDTRPTLSGTGEAGATVTLTITGANGATQTVTTTVDGSGNFSVDVPTDLAEGSFTVSATTSDDAGNTASASGTGNIDTIAPVLTLTNPGDTNDTTPTLTGTGEAGATVTLTITDANGATQTVTTTVDGAGNFSVDVPIDLAEGNFTVSATTSDDAGNTASASGTGNIDTIAPLLTLTNPGETNDTTPTLTGTGEAGATVTLTITDANGATQTVTTTVDGAGNFSLDVPIDLAEGNFTVSATTSDDAGNNASASGTGNIDTTAPLLTLTNPGETNDTTPTLTGTGEAGATVSLTITDANGATQTVTTTVDGSGNFSVDVPTDLAEGNFTVSATTSDAAGNTASASGTGNIDTTAPVLTLTNPGETNDTTPTLTGTGEAGATVTLTITDANGATQTVTTTVDGSGNFSVDVPTDLAEGSFKVNATTSDDAGNTASASGTGNIDTTAPVLTLTNPGETNDTTPTLTGTGEAGATVTLTITDANGATQTVTTTVDGSGNFSVDVPTDLAEGSFTVSATTSDAAGNTASASGTGNIDTTAPALTLTNPGETNDTTPTLTGTGEVGATVTLTITDANGTTQTVTTTVDGSGNFSVDVPTDLAEGNFTVSATTSDDAGNSASASGTGNIDTTAPVLTLTNPGETNDTTPTLTGTGEAGATVTLTITDANGATQTVTTTVDGSGNFSVDVPTELAEGNFSVSATTSDDAGNAASASGTGNIDTTAPVLTLTNPGDTNDTTPTLTGTGEAGATVTLTITDANGATQTVTTTVDGSGNFSVNVPTDLAEGSFTVSATTTDDAGNSASASGTGNIDTTAPVLTLTNPGEINDTTPTLTGSGEAGATVTLTITDANGTTQTVTTTADGSGNFSVDVPTDLAEGNFTVSATTTDDAGNTASASGTGNIDTTAPVLTLTNPGETNDTTPTLTGTGEAGATVTLTITDANGATQTVTTTVDGSGNFSVDVPTDLAEGSFTVNATTSDDAGNTASASGTGNIDTTVPVISINDPGVGSDATPTITGSTDASAGSTVSLSVTDDNGVTQNFSATVASDGTYSADVPSDLAEGNYTVSATVSDSAGNSASATATGEVNSNAPLLTIDPPGILGDATPLISGTTDVAVGTTVTIVVTDALGVSQTFFTTVQADLTYSASVPAILAEGGFNIAVSVTNGVGVTASVSTSGTIDTVDPVISLDVVGTTNVDTPVISGSCDEIGATVNISVVDGDGTTHTVSATVQSDGTFSVTMPSALPEGLLTVNATVLDDAGNLATASTSGLIDLTLPTLSLASIGDINNDTPVITGTCDEIGATVNISVVDGDGTTHTVSATVQSDGTFSVTMPSALPEGLLTVNATVLDDAGNLATASTSGLIDLTLPTLSLASIGDINNDTPVISGTCDEIGATVSISVVDGDGTTHTVSATVQSDGTFSVTMPSALPEGLLTVNATVLDDAGNLATASTSGLIDLTLPTLSLASIGSINNDTPVISGTCDEIGATVNISVVDGDGTTHTVSATVQSDGTFSVTMPSALPEGLLTVNATVLDDAGNLATASTSGLIDLTLPTLSLASIGDINNDTPVISGTCDEIGATVSISVVDGDGTTHTVSATVQSDGTFSVTMPSALPEGLLTVNASVLDDAGNLATASTSGLIDLTLPTLSLASIGDINNDTPVISGTCDEIGATVNISVVDGDGTTHTVSATVQSDGTFSVTMPSALPEGLLTVNATVLDDAGNLATASTSGLIDLTLPTLSLASIGSINNDTPVISGTCDEIGATVNISVVDGDGTTHTVSATVQSDGTFSVTMPSALPEGLLTVNATVLDDAGNLATASTSGLIDLTLPTLSLASIGSINNDTPVISGTCDEIGATVSISVVDGDGTTHTVSATVQSDGTFSVTMPSALPEGLLTVNATVLDDAGNLATASTSGLIDLTLPTLSLASIGDINNDTPVISGTCDEIGATVNISVVDGDGTTHTVSATVQSDGTFSVTMPSALPEGLLTVNATVLDDAGNLATASTSGLIDLTLPTLSLASIGDINNDTPVISGTCDEIGATVNISVVDGDGTTHTVSTTVQSDGTFSVTMPSALPEGLLTVNATVLDDAGNLATASTSGLIDLTLPTLSLASIGSINNDTPVISGTCDEIGATVNISVVDSDGTTHTVSATVQSDGTFSVTMPSALPEGLLTVNATVLDDAGNLATASTSGLIDLTLPTLSLASIGDINSDTPVISGTCDEIGATVNISVVDGDGTTHTVSATVQSDGTFSVTMPSALPEGLLTVNATVLDDAGNLATASTSGLIDLTLPTLSLASIGDINNDTPVISGTCDEIGATVSISVVDGDGTTHTVSATVQSDGTFSVTMPSALPEGLLTVNATVLDDAGNLATASTSGLIDLTLPTLSLASIGDINNDTPVISGTCDEIGATVNISVVDGDGTTHTVSATVQSDGTFSVTMPSALPEGLLTVNATVLDDAGNLATASTSGLIDLTLPTLSLASIGSINNDTPVISGTCDEIGATVSISVVDGDGTTHTVSATVQSDGTFSVTMPSALPEGLLTVNATVLDDAGNLATASTSGLIDLTLPTLSLASIGSINNDTPVISGTCDEIGATVNISVVDGDGTTHTVSATVQSDGTFSVTMPSALPEGLLTVNATVLDDAGNLASAGTSGLIDLTVPLFNLDSLGSINDTTPTISGTSDEIGATVSITTTDDDGSIQTFDTTVGSDGNFSIDIPLDVAEGVLNVSASVSDDAGNVSSDSITGLIDITAPSLALTALPTLLSPIVSGTTDTDMVGRTLNIDVTAEILGITQTISLSTTILADGSWSTGPIASLGLGPVSVSVSITDEAGNIATLSQSGTVSLSSGGSGSPLLGTDSASDSAQSDADAKLLNLINDLNKPTDI